MSEAKYRALLFEALFALENVGLMENYIDFDGVATTKRKIEAALAEPHVQAEPVVLPLPNFIRRDVERAIQEAVHPKGMAVHDGIARIGADRLSIMLKVIDHPPAAQASSCSNCERCQESLNALDDITEAQGKANAELVEALEGLVKINEDHNKAVQEIIGGGVTLGWKDSYLDKARAALAKYKEDCDE